MNLNKISPTKFSIFKTNIEFNKEYNTYSAQKTIKNNRLHISQIQS